MTVIQPSENRNANIVAIDGADYRLLYLPGDDFADSLAEWHEDDRAWTEKQIPYARKFIAQGREWFEDRRSGTIAENQKANAEFSGRNCSPNS